MKQFLVLVSIMLAISTTAQTQLQQGFWRASLIRKDNNAVMFNFKLQYVNSQPVLYIINAAERIKVANIVVTKDDSVIIQMPVFESQFRAKLINKTKLEGVWIKGGAKENQIMPFFAVANDGKRFTVTAAANKNISGKWVVSFGQKANTAIAIFQQKGTQLSGSIVTPTGDYRYLDGVVNGDTLLLSTFDGGHAFLFSAIINSNKTISNGKFYSGATSSEVFTAIKNDTATLPDLAAMQVKDGDGKLNFSFKGLDGKFVSLTDERFKNKVVIVQLMGSWCPNCMDETAF